MIREVLRDMTFIAGVLMVAYALYLIWLPLPLGFCGLVLCAAAFYGDKLWA